jgi:phosphoribosylanthranilate isomerase
MKKMLIKICGMRYMENIQSVSRYHPDFMGFIFYPQSPRYVKEDESLPVIQANIKKVGVFVDQSWEEMIHLIDKHKLDGVQFHGHESEEITAQMKQRGLIVIKAFRIDRDFDFSLLSRYEAAVDYFLFDTKGKVPGGTGQTFDWSLLQHYSGSVPFLLSGGLSEQNIQQAMELKHARLAGVDLNSGVEISPGIKDLKKISRVIQTINK